MQVIPPEVSDQSCEQPQNLSNGLANGDEAPKNATEAEAVDGVVQVKQS